MKGIIFTEFMELVESRFGLEVLDTILEASNDEGIYTSVGSYDHKNLVKLIINLSQTTNIPAEKLQEIFGEVVFINLYKTIPSQASLIKSKHCFQFIRHVEEYIHVEVKKLYPDAFPPRFEFISENETELVMNYKSDRCMSHVCFGLLKGCANYFNQRINIQMKPINDSGSEVQFSISLV